MQFVIIHGAYGSPTGNWFPELAENLEELGQEVIVPQFPVEKWADVVERGKGYQSPVQTLDNWLAVFEREVLPKLDKKEKLCFIGHSLGPVFILHAALRFNLKLDTAIFVSPFLGPLSQWEFNAVNSTFYAPDDTLDFARLQKLILTSYVLYSDDDPYVPQDQPRVFAEKLGSSLIPIRKAGHINSEVNLNEFPLVFDLCTTRLDLSIWQQYLAHRKQTFGIDFVRERPGSVGIFKPDEIFNWQVFVIERLQHSGFCTFYTGVKDWDPHSQYFADARKATARLERLERVFMVEQLADLRNPKLREQISLDLQAGIKAYLCQLHDVEDEIGEVDFGIWDDEFYCLIRFDKERATESVEINTRQDDLARARRWKRTILAHATGVHSLADVDMYAKTRSDSVVYLSPDEVTDEGIFKFRHLAREGFCTFYLPGAEFWNEQSKYMEEARRAAKRVGNVTRVFIAESARDFDKPLALKQINDDLASGMKVYVCLRKDIARELQAEPDFGIWDNEYVCVVNFNDKNQAIRARLSSLEKDIATANAWKAKILEQATQIKRLNDLLALA